MTSLPTGNRSFAGSASILGADVALFVSYWLVTIFANWYGPRFIESDSDINDAYSAALLFMLEAFILGGFAGFRLSRRREKP